MITVEDFNSILLKYRYSNVFHEIDFSLISNYPVQYDFCNITRTEESGGYNYTVEVVNSFWTGRYYFKSISGELLNIEATEDNKVISFFTSNEEFILGLHITDTFTSPYLFREVTWKPISNLKTMLVGDNFKPKIYIDFLGDIPNYLYLRQTGEGTSISTRVVHRDETGYYITIKRLKPFDEYIIYCNTSDGCSGRYYGIFMKYRDIPQITVDTVYSGCENTLTVYYNGEPTEKYKAYYKGNLLKDNKIDLREYLSIDNIFITIKITDPAYYNTDMIVEVPVERFKVSNKSDLDEVIANKYYTIRTAPITISNVNFDYPLRIRNSHPKFKNCTFTDLILENCGVTINWEDCVFNNLTIEDTTISKGSSVTQPFIELKVLNQLTCKNSEFENIFVKCGTDSSFNSTSFRNSLIFSDNKITINECSFTGDPINTKYPNMLYLTGQYTCVDNDFNLSGTFEDLTFNACILKTLEGFNADSFISNNRYNVDIVVGGEEINGFTYCLVDDDTIYLKR